MSQLDDEWRVRKQQSDVRHSIARCDCYWNEITATATMTRCLTAHPFSPALVPPSCVYSPSPHANLMPGSSRSAWRQWNQSDSLVAWLWRLHVRPIDLAYGPSFLYQLLMEQQFCATIFSKFRGALFSKVNWRLFRIFQVWTRLSFRVS